MTDPTEQYYSINNLFQETGTISFENYLNHTLSFRLNEQKIKLSK